jgi:hypothetical protein
MRPDDELPVIVVTVVAGRWRYAAAVPLHTGQSRPASQRRRFLCGG